MGAGACRHLLFSHIIISLCLYPSQLLIVLSMNETIKRPRKEEVEMADVKMGDAASLPPHANSAHDDSVNRVQRDIEEVKESIKKTEGNIESTEADIKITEADLKFASQNVFNCAPEDKDYWKLTAAKLMDEKAALRTEKAKLMDKEAKLMDKEAKLRDDVRNASNIATTNLMPANPYSFLNTAKKMSAPSTFGKTTDWPYLHGLFHHRPPGSAEGKLHVTLYSQAMAQFCSDVNNSDDLDQEACDFVENLCLKMRNTFLNEAARQESFLEAFNGYYTTFYCTSIGGWLETDGTILEKKVGQGITHHGIMLLNLEVKNEKGLTGCDCVMQNLGYFVKFWAKVHNQIGQRCASRSYLVSLDGCMLYVFGAVVVDESVHMDPLCPAFNLLLLVDDPGEMKRLVSFVVALRTGLQNLSKELMAEQPPGIKFPYLEELPGTLLSWKYERELKRRVFVATLNSPQNSPQRLKVVVKFSPHGQASELQELLARHSYAPALLGYACINPWWHVSVSDFIPSTGQGGSLSVKEKQDLCDAVKLMHDNGWVHGDLREPNILRTDGSIRIVDFEFSGRENQARYPLFLNHTDINWPEGVAAQKPLMKRHDEEMLRRILDDGWVS
jgi:hypothetical protein